MLLAFAFALCLSAQEADGQQKFSPDKFDAELRQFITDEAKLTEQEAEKFFPVYKEMQAMQRVVFGKQKALAKSTPGDEEACKEAIRQRDENDLEMKRIQQTYHEKFLKLLPASKVYAILLAEDQFHRRMLKRANPYGQHDRNVKGHPGQNDKGHAGQNPNWKKRE